MAVIRLNNHNASSSLPFRFRSQQRKRNGGTSSTLVVTSVCRQGLLMRLLFLVILLIYSYSLIHLHDSLKQNQDGHPETHSSTAKEVDSSIEESKHITIAIAPKEQERALQVIVQQKKKQATSPPPKPPIQIVDTSTWAKPSSTYVIDAADLWETGNSISDLTLPNWMINYLRWHKEQTMNLVWGHDSYTLPNKYLFVTCFKEYNKCGGTADRLLSIPFFLKVAASTNRVLLIQWTKPAMLEEFLVPPAHGIDWRVVRGMDAILIQHGTKVGTQDTILQYAVQSNVTVVQTKFQSHDHGSIYYDTYRESYNEPEYEMIFHYIWKIFFTPSVNVAHAIATTMDRDDLIPGSYTSAHVRGLYQAENRDHHLLQVWTDNAIRCALQLQQPQHQQLRSSSTTTLPVYFASDSDFALRHAIYFGKIHGQHVVTLPELDHSEDALHIDKTKDWNIRPVSDFYGIFVDLYIMALSKCVTYGMGGFGKLASLMTSNPTCSIVHMTATSTETCTIPGLLLRRRRSGVETEIRHTDNIDYSRYFFAPMEGHHHSSLHHARKVFVHANDNLLAQTEPPSTTTEPPKKKRVIMVHQDVSSSAVDNENPSSPQQQEAESSNTALSGGSPDTTSDRKGIVVLQDVDIVKPKRVIILSNQDQ